MSNSGVFDVNDIRYLMDYQQWSGVGTLELIQTQTFTGVGTVDFTNIKEDEYNVHFMTGIVTGNGNNRPWLKFYESGVLEEGSVYHIATQQQTTGASQNKSTSSTNLEFLCGASETGEMSGAYVYVYNAGDSDKYTYSTTQSMMTSTLRSQFGGGCLPQTSTVDGFRIESSGETTLNGTISLYGIRYS